MTLLLKGGTVVASEHSGNGVKNDVLIKDSVIKEIGENLEISSDTQIIDCTGLTILPGIFDMHVHLRDPGQTYKEDLQSGTNAAATGGVTGLLCMPNTTPVIDTPETVQNIIERSYNKKLKSKIYVCGAITHSLKGEKLTDFAVLKKAGAIAISDDGMPVVSDDFMSKAMQNAKTEGLAIISHCEPENEMTAREVRLAKELGVPVHIAHVSTKVALSSIQTAISEGAKITYEIAPHHFTLTKTDCVDADYKMNPPLREPEDVQAMLQTLISGEADCIASDHAPHSPEEKQSSEPPNGVLGLETLLPITLTRLFHKDNVSLERIVELLCVNPRKILGISGGTIKVGETADLAIVDLNQSWIVNPDKLQSKSRNTCFKGMELKGKIKYTVLDGKVVYKDG
ncbi:MAG: dihydroorotase [Oscillospiraceae bacterium]|nr:dihydroorotase [Oscillospiraceae bacterium]